MANEQELKNLIIEIGKRIWTKGYVVAGNGNITVKLNDNEILTTPNGVSKGFMTTEMITKVDKNGKVISKNSMYKP
jgi:L-fuculose-phosphate aldolase